MADSSDFTLTSFSCIYSKIYHVYASRRSIAENIICKVLDAFTAVQSKNVVPYYFTNKQILLTWQSRMDKYIEYVFCILQLVYFFFPVCVFLDPQRLQLALCCEGPVLCYL